MSIPQYARCTFTSSPHISHITAIQDSGEEDDSDHRQVCLLLLLFIFIITRHTIVGYVFEKKISKLIQFYPPAFCRRYIWFCYIYLHKKKDNLIFGEDSLARPMNN